MDNNTNKKRRPRKNSFMGSRVTIFKVFPELSNGSSNGQEMILNPTATTYKEKRRKRRDKHANDNSQPERPRSSISQHTLTPYHTPTSYSTPIDLPGVLQESPPFVGVADHRFSHPIENPSSPSPVYLDAIYPTNDSTAVTRGLSPAILEYTSPMIHTVNPAAPSHFPPSTQAFGLWESDLPSFDPCNVIPVHPQLFHPSLAPATPWDAVEGLIGNYPNVGDQKAEHACSPYCFGNGSMVSSTPRIMTGYMDNFVPWYAR